VLGGGVENRYTTRLKNVIETLQTFDKTLPFAAELFKYVSYQFLNDFNFFFKRHTGFQSIEQLVKILSLLVSETERFVTLEPSTKPLHGQKQEDTVSFETLFLVIKILFFFIRTPTFFTKVVIRLIITRKRISVNLVVNLIKKYI
jgi:hypothetical protein